MAMVIYAPSKKGHHDRSIEREVQAFLRKLWDDDTAPGLHIEPIKKSTDPRVRTGRVSKMYRAVLFKIVSSAGQPHYVYTGTWPHDEAIKIAGSATLRVNAVNRIPELLLESETKLSVPRGDGTSLAWAHEPTPASRPDVTPSGGPAEQSATKNAEAVLQAPHAAAPQASTPLLDRINPKLTFAVLTEVVGLPAEVAEVAWKVTTDDQMIELASELSTEWQGLALLDLATGAPVNEVRDRLNLTSEPEFAGEDRTEDERLLDAIKSPAARSQFQWVEDDAELRAVIESGDFARWRTFLHPEQRRYAEQNTGGPFRLSGGAGTGKTVVLVHRARSLARRSPQSRILLTTFTRTLADALRRDLRLLDRNVPQVQDVGEVGVCVAGVDAAANQVVAGSAPDARAAAIAAVLGLTSNPGTQRPNDSRSPWQAAASAAPHGLPPALSSPAFLEAEYQHVVLPARITTLDAYLTADRAGRRVALGRGQRHDVWRIIEAYRASAAVDGVLSFAEVSAVAAELAAAIGGLCDHVLVDEGQDLSPVQWQFLRTIVAPGPNDLFIAEDSQQRIYGQRVVLGRLGIRIVGRSRRLLLNYRTTEQVLEYATRVLAGEQIVDLDGNLVTSFGYRSARRGPEPRAVVMATMLEALDRASEVIDDWTEEVEGSGEAIGILVRAQDVRDVVAHGLQERQVPVRTVTDSARSVRLPQLMTMHRAKGMEFAKVLIFGANDDLLPATSLVNGLPEEDRPDLVQRERSLLYVAMTRARDDLVVVSYGERSRFLPALFSD